REPQGAGNGSVPAWHGVLRPSWQGRNTRSPRLCGDPSRHSPLGMGSIARFRVSSPRRPGGGHMLQRTAIVGMLAATGVLLAACAGAPNKTQEPAEAADWARVERVALQVFRGGRALCGRAVAPTLGVAYTNRESFNRALQPATDKELGLDDHLKVTRIVDGSPAAKAGLQIGDLLESICGPLAPTPGGAAGASAAQVRALPAGDRPVPLEVERGGVTQTLTVTPELACDFGVTVMVGDQVNAYTNGRTIRVMSGLLGMVVSDDE